MGWLVIFVAVVAGCGPDEDHCDGNIAIRCRSNEYVGSSCSREDCGEESCVESVVASSFFNILCVPDPEPRAECLDAELQAHSTGYAICSGAELLYCSGGYLITTADCGAPELCHVAFGSNGFRHVSCILSATQDERCLPLPEFNYNGGVMPLCDGDLALDCFDGHLSRAEDCSPGTCVDGYCR